MREKLFYIDVANHQTIFNRSYAIHLLKKNHVISVYRSKSINDNNYVETWVDYIPKCNNHRFYYGHSLKATNKNCIIGYYRDKQHNCVIYARMPATKNILYLKDAEKI